jgi:hypothetical protein
MEPRFGRDFSQVRIHSDPASAAAAQAQGALAYTTGSDIVFGPGQYQPDTAAGRRLLAHELAHVVQQAGVTPSTSQAKHTSAPGDAAERAADDTARELGGLAAPEASQAVQLRERLQTTRVQRPMVLRAVESQAGVPPIVGEVLSSPGEPLDATTRASMERRLGYDLGQIRVHADSRAAESSAAVNADAYAVGGHLAFGAGQYAPHSAGGRRLLAHELAHVVQQGRGSGIPQTSSLVVGSADDAAERAADAVSDRQSAVGTDVGHSQPRLQRKIKLRGPYTYLVFPTWKDFTPAQRAKFVKANFSAANQDLATAIVEDMASATDEFEFENRTELYVEVFKRMRTSRLMRETQRDLGKLGKAFGYPRKNPDGTWMKDLGPRVNKAADKYWDPVQDVNGSYNFPLSKDGRDNAYVALKSLFTPQAKKSDRTLIHCDYLASVVHLRVFAETIGAKAFNDRVKNGTIPVILKWNGFEEIETSIFRSASRESLQEVRPSSEKDLVIGDHVIFWNHRTYDLINAGIHEAWRLENAVLVDKTKRGADIFLGHGSGEQTKAGMLGKLVAEYNKVTDMALSLIDQTRSKDPKTSKDASDKMATKFPWIKPAGTEWHIRGSAHGKTFDKKVQPITASDPELIGLKDPSDPTRMNLVKRPKESA